jgi:spermidine/putrescine transport system substrate-binding protein
MHPREGWSEGGIRRRPEPEEAAISRRQLLGAGAGLAMGAVLAGCGGSSGGGSGSTTLKGAGGVPLPRQNNPVTWPIFSDNKPIAANLQPEKGATLQIYNWVAYINEATIKNFCKKYNCKYQLTTFNTMSEAIAKLGSGQLQFDIFFPTVDVLGQLIEAKMIRPLNHSYIPNLTNTWSDYHSPFYDVGSRYTMPYSIYTTGIAWRKDKVNLTPGWDMPWRASQYKGKVAILDDYREGLGLALLKAGNLDLNTTSNSAIQAAGKSLQQLSSLTNVRIDNNDYTDVPTGKTWVHHAWSGDIAAAYSYLPKGTPIDVLGYWFPSNHRGPVANDLMVNLKSGSNPVLSHLFINYFLDTTNALDNYSYYGYMSPLNGVTPQRLISEKLLPAQLSSTVVLPDYFRNGIFELELPPAANSTWETTWNQFSKGL